MEDIYYKLFHFTFKNLDLDEPSELSYFHNKIVVTSECDSLSARMIAKSEIGNDLTKKLHLWLAQATGNTTHTEVLRVTLIAMQKSVHRLDEDAHNMKPIFIVSTWNTTDLCNTLDEAKGKVEERLEYVLEYQLFEKNSRDIAVSLTELSVDDSGVTAKFINWITEQSVFQKYKKNLNKS